jgi:hypothetical protein
MYLMYVDESGDSGLVNSPTDYFALSGIVVHEQRWRPFIDALVAFKRAMRAAHGLKIRTEIHASEFINNRVDGLKRHVRLSILRNALDELAKLSDISITNVIVSKVGKPADYDVFSNAWRALFQRFENTLCYGNFPGSHRSDFGAVFTDDTGGAKLVRIMRRMNVYNPVPNVGGDGYRDMPVVRIIEDPHGKESATALAIQMADVCAYFLHQRFKPNSYIRRQRAVRYFDRLTPVLNLKARINGTLGIVEL